MGRYIVPILFWTIIAAVAMLLAVSAGKQTKTPNEILSPFQTEEALPGGTVTDSNGQQASLDDLIKPNTLVVFWNIHCDECQKTLRDTEALALKQPDLRVVIISQRNTVKEALEKLAEYRVSLPNYFDLSGEVFATWQSTMPGVFFVDENREIVLRFPGRPTQEHYESIEGVYFSKKVK